MFAKRTENVNHKQISFPTVPFRRCLNSLNCPWDADEHLFASPLLPQAVSCFHAGNKFVSNDRGFPENVLLSRGCNTPVSFLHFRSTTGEAVGQTEPARIHVLPRRGRARRNQCRSARPRAARCSPGTTRTSPATR